MLKNIKCLNNLGFQGRTFEFQNVYVGYDHNDDTLLFKDFIIVITNPDDMAALEVILKLYTNVHQNPDFVEPANVSVLNTNSGAKFKSFRDKLNLKQFNASTNNAAIISSALFEIKQDPQDNTRIGDISMIDGGNPAVFMQDDEDFYSDMFAATGSNFVKSQSVVSTVGRSMSGSDFSGASPSKLIKSGLSQPMLTPKYEGILLFEILMPYLNGVGKCIEFKSYLPSKIKNRLQGYKQGYLDTFDIRNFT